MKQKNRKKNFERIKGFSIQFIPYSEIKNLNSDERIKKILEIVFGNKIIILQGKLKAEEETRLIGDTMAMIGYVKGFKGIELAVISGNGEEGFLKKLKHNLITSLSGGDIGAITIIGPATIVKEIKKDPKQIELLLNK
jgi:hypothetical protein